MELDHDDMENAGTENGGPKQNKILKILDQMSLGGIRRTGKTGPPTVDSAPTD